MTFVKPLSSAFERSFPSGREWAADAADRLGLDITGDLPVQSVAQGWMRLGGVDAVLVDTLFVLSERRLGFGQTFVETDEPNWVELASIKAIDLIEGTLYPLEAIEVQFANGFAMFVGWPEDFVHAVVGALTPAVHSDATSTMERVLAAHSMPAFMANQQSISTPLGVDLGGPKAFSDGPATADPIEGDSSMGSEAQAAEPETTEPEATEPETVPEASDVGDAMAAVLAAADVRPVMGHVGDPGEFERPGEFEMQGKALGSEEAADVFFAETQAAEHATVFQLGGEDLVVLQMPSAAEDVTGPWDDPGIIWPEPLRNCVFLGGHPVHQRRRKSCTIMMNRGGMLAASGSWKAHVPWHMVRRIDIQGPDEIKFTHNQRISATGCALVIEAVDNSVYLFEFRSQRPATIRSALSIVINMANLPRSIYREDGRANSG